MFINYSKTFHPVLSPEADEALLTWWTDLRVEEQKEGSVAVDVRTLEDLTRITEAYARMDLTNNATDAHANRAIKLINDSLHTLGMSTPGEKNDSVINAFNKDEAIEYILKQGVSHEVAINRLMELKWIKSETQAGREIQKLRNNGNLLETEGKYEWVS